AGQESGSLMTLELQIRLLKAQNRIDDALVRLKEYVKKKDANLELAAGLFEELGQAGLAEENYRKWMSQARATNRGLVLAGFLGRQNRAGEALDLCERAAGLGSVEAAAAVSIGVVRESRDPREQQFQRVERLLDEASKKNPAAPGPYLELAELRQLQQRYAEAEALDRKSVV